jgi:hypothetical protein
MIFINNKKENSDLNCYDENLKTIFKRLTKKEEMEKLNSIMETQEEMKEFLHKFMFDVLTRLEALENMVFESYEDKKRKEEDLKYIFDLE